VSELAAHISVLEAERAAAIGTISGLRQELADRQLALSAAQDAAKQALQQFHQLAAGLNEFRHTPQVTCQGFQQQHLMWEALWT